MLGARPNRKPTFFWQGLLIVLPVAVMSVIGLLAIRRDRVAVEAEARRGADQLAAQLSSALANRMPAQFAAYNHFSDLWYKHQWEQAKRPQLLNQDGSYPTQLAEWEAANPGATAADVLPNWLAVDVERKIVWPTDYDEPPQTPTWLINLTEPQREAWNRISACIPGHSGTNSFHALMEQFIATKPSPEASANAEFLSFKAKVGQKDAAQDLQALETISDWYPGSRSESGVPLLNLLDAEALRLLSQSGRVGKILSIDSNDRGGYLADLVGWALDEPSLLTPQLLDQLEALLGKNHEFQPALSAAREIWTAQQRLHGIGAALRRQDFLFPSIATNFWLASPTDAWFCTANRGELATVEHEKDGSQVRKTNSVAWLRVYPLKTIAEMTSRAVREAGVVIPEYVSLQIELESQRLALTQRRATTATLNGSAGHPTLANILAENRGSLDPLPTDWSAGNAGQGPLLTRSQESPVGAEFKIQVCLVDPQLLYAQQRQRTFLFGGLILASTAAACVGLAAAYRAFRRQLRLSELKSNFVSSVSHELRAPIASVRLMAESLELGKISDSKKQHEYFRFIVQECRRLSSLIENVLDFSRIEQGRKQFEFEPTDILALTTQTVKLMQAYAVERQVDLALSVASNLESSKPQISADGKAVQQALINLIDNAVKHSPKGQTVTVGLQLCGGKLQTQHSDSAAEGGKSSDRQRLALWVEDQGEGIPHEEHAKIFERFYRLGSELRRETQGVGIGLSIVKHVVEAHGGRVLVDSAVGKGSRFTIELPLAGEQHG
jgi:signal transduction histidine kinase